MGQKFDRTMQIGSAIIGIAMVSRMVLRPQTPEIITAAAEGFSRMIKVATGETAIERRDVPRFEEVLGAMDDPVMTELFAGLTDTDLDWVVDMLGDVS